MATDLSAEEFHRLQAELLTLKMQNHDLAEGNRRTRQLMEGNASAAAVSTAVLTSAANSSATAGAPAAAGANSSGRTAAGFGSLLARRMSGGMSSSTKSAAARKPSPQPSPGGGPQIEMDDEIEALNSEVDSLRIRLSATLEELNEVRRSARAAQQAAVTASQGGSGGDAIDNSTSTSCSTPSVNVSELRQRLAAWKPERWGASGDKTISDDYLVHIATAVLQLTSSASPSPVPCASAAAHSESEQGDGADFLTNALLRIQKQQKQLETIRESVDQQSSQISRLTEYVSAQIEAAGDGLRPSESSLPPEERLRAAEKQKEELGRRLETSEGFSRHLYELQCHLQVLDDKVQQRDKAIETLLATQEQEEAAQVQLRERLALTEEDLAAFLHRQRWEAPTSVTKDIVADNTDCQGKSAGATTDLWTRTVSKNGTGDRQLHSVESLSSGRRTLVNSSVGEAAVQADFALEFDGEDALSACKRLQEELDKLRAEKESIERDSALEAQALRAAIRGPKVEYFDIASPTFERKDSLKSRVAPEEPLNLESSGVLYEQKIEELEALHVGLERDLEILRESKQCLIDDIKEKEGLISFLMRRSAENNSMSNGSDVVASTDRPPRLKNMLGALPAALRGRGGQNADADAHLDELERIAQEALHDNSRLKNDLRTFAEELNKAFAAKSNHNTGTQAVGR